jgi:tetratricopeptide (TPR) repeat protein
VNGAKKLWIIAGIVLLLALGAGVFFGRPAYHQFKENRAVKQAEEFIQTGDLRSANLSLRVALALNSSNLTANLMMANLMDQAQSPAAIAYRKRVWELQPTLTNRLFFAACALRYEKPPFPIAAEVLNEMSGVGETNTEYHLVASQLALKLNQLTNAESHLQSAAKLDPTNLLHQLNLATVRLQSTDSSAAAAARHDLAMLISDPVLGLPALRSLTADSITRHDGESAAEYGRKLGVHSKATLDDRLLELTALNEAKATDFSKVLAEVQNECKTNSVTLALAVSWMNGHGLARPALDWLVTLPDAVKDVLPAPLAEADCYMTLKDWAGLQSRLVGHRWDEQDFLRFAMLSRALREQGQREMSGRNWRLALSAAKVRPEQLLVLQQLVQVWGWEDETKDLLWALVERAPKEEWPLKRLMQTYAANGDSEGIYRVYQTLLERNPDSAEIKNNVAALGLLLGRNRARSIELAREVYEGAKTNVIIASTYAFALHTEGKTSEALKLLQTFPDAELKRPEVALYYGVLLASTGEKGKAEMYFAAAEKGKPLAQERALMAEARR